MREKNVFLQTEIGNAVVSKREEREKKIYVHTFIFAFPSHSIPLVRQSHAYRHSIGLVICSLTLTLPLPSLFLYIIRPPPCLLNRMPLYFVRNSSIIYVYIIGLNLYWKLLLITIALWNCSNHNQHTISKCVTHINNKWCLNRSEWKRSDIRTRKESSNWSRIHKREKQIVPHLRFTEKGNSFHFFSSKLSICSSHLFGQIHL